MDQPLEELVTLPRLALWNGLFYERLSRMKPPAEFAPLPPESEPAPPPEPAVAPSAPPTRSTRLAPELQEWLGGAPARQAPPGYAYEFGSGRVVPVPTLPSQFRTRVVQFSS